MKLRVAGALTIAVISIGFVSDTAVATHTEPVKAQKATFALVNGFAPCS